MLRKPMSRRSSSLAMKQRSPILKYRASAAALVLGGSALSLGVLAQEAGQAPPGAEPPAPTEGALEPPASPTEPGPSSVYTPPGTGGSAAPDVNSGLGAGDRPSAAGSDARDGFNFGVRGGGTGTTLRGSAGGAYVVSGSFVPELHSVQRGETLWEISARHYGNAYAWPRIWAYNPQVQNPHWLYPGDQIRLREQQVYERSGGLGLGLSKLARTVTPSAQFQRFLGFVLDDKHPKWGEVTGSPDEQMILSELDDVYLKLEGNREYRVGQKLIVFEPLEVKSLSEDPFVWIRGIVQIERYNPNSKIARARILESLTEIERGAMIGPFDETMDVIESVPNAKALDARIVGALYPYEFYTQHQVVFIDKGSEDGLKVGNRLFAVGRGDPWREGLRSAGPAAAKRAITEDDRRARVEDTPPEEHAAQYPVETYGELIVTRTRKHTATCLITAATRELERGSTLVAREGY